MDKKTSLFIVFLLLVISGILFFINLKGTEHIKGTKVLDMIKNIQTESNSDFSFTTVMGEEIKIDVDDKIFKIKGMEDRIIFLKVFGWNCKFCKKEIPELVNLKNKLGDAFEVIAVEAQQHTREESLDQINKYGINYHIVSGDGQNEFYTYLQNKYGWTGIIPLTIVIAKNGNVLAFELGAKSYSLSELMKASLLRD